MIDRVAIGTSGQFTGVATGREPLEIGLPRPLWVAGIRAKHRRENSARSGDTSGIDRPQVSTLSVDQRSRVEG